MINIYDTANQLEREIRQLPQFEELQTAYNEMMNTPESKAVFEEFQQAQQNLQLKQMQGEELTEEDAQHLQVLSEKIQNDAHISTLMQKEQAFSAMLNELNEIIMKPIQELYGNM